MGRLLVAALLLAGGGRGLAAAVCKLVVEEYAKRVAAMRTVPAATTPVGGVDAPAAGERRAPATQTPAAAAGAGGSVPDVAGRDAGRGSPAGVEPVAGRADRLGDDPPRRPLVPGGCLVVLLCAGGRSRGRLGPARRHHDDGHGGRAARRGRRAWGTYAWVGGATTSPTAWSNGDNWSGMVAPPTTGSAANVVFTPTNNTISQLDQSYAVNSLTFNNGASGYTVRPGERATPRRRFLWTAAASPCKARARTPSPCPRT